MRISRPLAGIITAALLGLVPLTTAAPASAAESTTATLELYRNKAVYGQDLLISGAVKAPSGYSPDGVAYLQMLPAGSSAWKTIASDTAPGYLYFPSVKATGNASYRAYYPGSASYTGSYSPAVAVKVQRKLSIKNPRGTLIKGKVSPSYKRGKVVIQRKVGKKWRKYKVLRANAQGRFQTTHKVFGRSTNYRLTIPASKTFTKNVWKYRAIR